MIRNYFKTAWRNLLRNKFYSIINISGLAIGLAVGVMVLLWVQDELSYDTFHANAETIYKVNAHLGTGSAAQVWGTAPAPLTVLGRDALPEIVNAVRIKTIWEQRRFDYGRKKIISRNAAYVDSGFFSLFDFRLLSGNAKRPFTDQHAIVLSSSLAKEFFGPEEPLGKTLVSGKDNYVVSGVMADFPHNSHLHFDMLFPMSGYASIFTAGGGNGAWKTIDEDLGNFEYLVYFQLRKDGDPGTVAKKITDLFNRKKGKTAKDEFFTLQPLKTMHLVASDGNDGALKTVQIFLMVAVLILGIACINYVNLSTARSMLRSKEVSVRKIIGAARAQLFIQFMAESALMFLLASMLAFGLIFLLLPLYNEISGKHLLFSLSDGNVWLVIGLAVTGTLLLAAVYPALLLSSFKPIQALKGKISFGLGNASFRKMLVIIQFIFSVALIIATVIISNQLRYIRDKNLGFDKEHVFTFAMKDNMHDHYEAVRAGMLQSPGVLGIATANNNIAGVNSTTGDTEWEGKEKGSTFLIHPNGIDDRLIPLLNIEMKAGRNFNGSKSDSTNIILNETAVRQTGIKDPIGKIFGLWGTRCMIIGVIKDFNYASLREAIEPTAFYYRPAGWRMFVKTSGSNAAQAIAAAEKAWKQYNADYPFEYSFLDDDFNQMYQAEQHIGTLFSIFAAVAIIISCLGLFSLATFTAEVKTREIGIRKVLGASILNIAGLLAREFVMLVFIAFVIATPLTWIMMDRWLQNYAYRIGLAWWIFAGTGILVMAIALLTVCFQSLRAAMANPVNSLRAE